MSNVEHASWWESKYQAGTAPWDLGAPAPSLLTWLQRRARPTGRAIVLGAGRGHDAIALAEAGYEVTAVDFSASAIAEAKAAAAQRGVTIEFLARDMFTLLPELEGRFDLVFEHTCFCAIPPERRADYVEVAHGLLVPGGTYLAIFFTHREPGGPPFGTSFEEIEQLFSPRFDLLALVPAPASVPQRQGDEHLGEFMKR